MYRSLQSIFEWSRDENLIRSFKSIAGTIVERGGPRVMVIDLGATLVYKNI